MPITTVLTFPIRYSWKYPPVVPLATGIFFFVVDLAFTSNMLAAGGWLVRCSSVAWCSCS
jgi:hypothetical protein